MLKKISLALCLVLCLGAMLMACKGNATTKRGYRYAPNTNDRYYSQNADTLEFRGDSMDNNVRRGAGNYFRRNAPFAPDRSIPPTTLNSGAVANDAQGRSTEMMNAQRTADADALFSNLEQSTVLK